MLEKNMTVKKVYQIGDDVWIYGITRNNVKPTKGKIIKIVDIDGYLDKQYIIEIPTHIESLLEIRSWHNISQDEKGPIGSFRNIKDIEPTIKFATRTGFAFDDSTDLDLDDGPTVEQIHAALEKAQKDLTHQPLIIKEPKSRRRTFRKKKQ